MLWLHGLTGHVHDTPLLSSVPLIPQLAPLPRASLQEEQGVGRDRKVKVPPLKEEGKWRRFFFGRSARGREEAMAAAAAAAAAGSGGDGSRKRPRLESDAADTDTAAAAAAEKEETTTGMEEGEEPPLPVAPPASDPAALSSPLPLPLPLPLAVPLPLPPGPGALKESFEGPTPPTTSLVLQFDQVNATNMCVRASISIRDSTGSEHPSPFETPLPVGP